MHVSKRGWVPLGMGCCEGCTQHLLLGLGRQARAHSCEQSQLFPLLTHAQVLSPEASSSSRGPLHEALLKQSGLNPRTHTHWGRHSVSGRSHGVRSTPRAAVASLPPASPWAAPTPPPPWCVQRGACPLPRDAQLQPMGIQTRPVTSRQGRSAGDPELGRACGLQAGQGLTFLRSFQGSE